MPICVLLFLFLFVFFHPSQALPIPPYPAESSSPLAFGLSLIPFPILVIAKFVYLRYRRGKSIHAQNEESIISDESQRSLHLGPVKLEVMSSADVSGYLVGFLGSPDWEVKIKCRVDKATRKSKRPAISCSSPVQSVSVPRARRNSSGTTTGNGTSQTYSTATSKRRSQSSRSYPRSASASCVAFHTPHSQGDITSCSAVHPSSPACCCGPHLPALPPIAHPPVQTVNIRMRNEAPSPTLMQIMEPVLSSWYESDSLSQDRSTSSGANMSSGINTTSILYTSSIANTSSAFNTSSSGNTSSGAHTSSGADMSSTGHTSSENTRRTRSSSPSALVSKFISRNLAKGPNESPVTAPPFETPLTSPSSIHATQHITSITRRHIVQDVPTTPSNNEMTTPTPSSLSVSVFDAPVVSVPVTAYSPQVSQPTYDLLHEDWYRKSAGQPMQVLLSPTHSSPPVQPNILELVANPERRPFSRTTRPLNLTPKLQHSPLGHLSPVMNTSPTVKTWRRHSSGTPPNIPSPLRNAILFDSTSFPASASAPDIGTCVETTTTLTTTITTRGSWELEDLVRNGQLDVDAVSAALGLGLGVDLGDSSNVTTESARAMGWGRAREAGTTVLHMRPGALLCAIPEETDDIASVPLGGSSRFSSGTGSMLLDVDLDILNSYGNSSSGSGSGGGLGASRTGSSGLQDETQDASVIWEDEESWRDSHSYR